MQELVPGLEQRAATPAFEPTKKRPSPRKRADSEEPSATPRQLFNTSFSVFVQHRDLLRTVAFQRASSGAAARNDVGAVLRDVLDFWVDRRDEFEEWLRQRGDDADAKHNR
jgi:hypothetical protein